MKTFCNKVLLASMIMLVGVCNSYGIFGISALDFNDDSYTGLTNCVVADKFTVGAHPSNGQVISAVVTITPKDTDPATMVAGIYSHDTNTGKPDAASAGVSPFVCTFDTSSIPLTSDETAAVQYTLPVVGLCSLNEGDMYWFFIGQNGGSGSGALYRKDTDNGSNTFVTEVTSPWSGAKTGGHVLASFGGTWGALVDNKTSLYALNVIPEPSTYAMVFGVLAIGFVVVRRRKQ